MSKQEKKSVEEVQEVAKESVVLKISQDDANYFVNVLQIVLLGDDRLVPIQRNFIDIINRNNAENK